MVGFNEKFQSMYIESEITGNDEVPDPGTSLRREAARARARSRSMSHEGLITSHSTPITQVGSMEAPRSLYYSNMKIPQAIVSSSSMNHTSLPRTTAESSQVDFAPLPDLGQNLLPMDTLPMDFNFGLSFQPPLSAYDTPSSLYPGSTLNGTLSFQTSTDGLTEQMLDDNTATTLCRTALDMIAQHNRKGYSFKDLEVRLCRGYQPEASEGADCRVQNSVLFSVLAEIQ